MSVIGRVRGEREDLARTLKNHPGIRQRLVKDLYPDTAHFIYELLQNAEDARASEAEFRLSGESLVFEHNGRPFDEDDIRGITNIGEGTKAGDEDKIGRFGIGFKAVFAFTETPRIWSPTHSFEISEMVLPSELSSDPKLGERTRFEIPFDSGKKPLSDAFSEVRDGLGEISDNTLLFLSHIEKIQWRIDWGGKGCLRRIPYSDRHIEILRETNGRATEISHFLCFREPVDGLESQYAAIAFELKPSAGDAPPDAGAAFAKRFRIVPTDRGCVAAYFEAVKETSKLRFHLHAPFVTELSRSSIKNTTANDPFFRLLAGLAARSLLAIRDLGLLDREFLAVLPNSHDEIPAQYKPVREEIIAAMKEQPLTPMHADGHAPASRLLQAEAGLKDLLDRDDIGFLIDGDDDPHGWAIAATQRNNRVDRLLRDLEIKPWGVEQFVKILKDRSSNKQDPDQPFFDWLRRKSADWHRALYALFYRETQNALFYMPGTKNDPNYFNDMRIVRLSNGEYRTGSECYFPIPGTHEDPIHPRVAEDTYAGGGTGAEHKAARAFLKRIGVREVGEREEIEAILKQRYAASAARPSWNAHESDLKRFIALVEKDSNASSLFQEYFILQRADGTWTCTSGLYLDTPYLETGLQAYYGPLGTEARRAPLSDSYQDFDIDIQAQLVCFARACGVADHLEVEKVSCTENPSIDHLHSAPGKQTNSGTDRDFVIPELRQAFDCPNLILSRLVWETLVRKSKDNCILDARYRKNRSNLERDADSQLVHQLRDIKWIPQGSDTFVRPAQASRDLLPEGFAFDPGWAWLKRIRFGEETQERADQTGMATALGFPDEATLIDAQRFAKLPPDIRQEFFAENDRGVDLPVRKPANRERRAEKVRQEAREALERTTEKVQRSVSVNRDPIKEEKARPYLLELYTKDDDVTICQICMNELPFKLADGNYFFEAVVFLPELELEKHHYQNYLALCPNHAAMYMHANDAKDEMKSEFLALDGTEMNLTLADRSATIYFTETHIEDLRVIIEVEDAK